MFAYFRVFLTIAACAVFTTLGTSSNAQEMTFFRIGTGGIAGTYYPIGAMVALTISNPTGSRPCDQGGSCGILGLVGIPQSSNGSVSNIKAISRGSLESGFAQSDVIHWAYTGTGIFEGQPPNKKLRAISNLYPETIHVVARKGAGITQIRDLRGKRVSLDEPGSGTLVDARIVLSEHGLSENDLKPEYIKPDMAMRKIERGQLDAFFIVAGYPTASVSLLAANKSVSLVPIAKKEANAMVDQKRFFAHDIVPAGTYEGISEISTISVGAQWIVGAGVDEGLVYEITRALWNAASRKILDNGHPKGRAIVMEKALDGITIPLHPGAERYYREIGMVK